MDHPLLVSLLLEWFLYFWDSHWNNLDMNRYTIRKVLTFRTHKRSLIGLSGWNLYSYISPFSFSSWHRCEAHFCYMMTWKGTKNYELSYFIHGRYTDQMCLDECICGKLLIIINTTPGHWKSLFTASENVVVTPVWPYRSGPYDRSWIQKQNHGPNCMICTTFYRSSFLYVDT